MGRYDPSGYSACDLDIYKALQEQGILDPTKPAAEIKRLMDENPEMSFKDAYKKTTGQEYGGSGVGESGPYSHIPDGKHVGEGKDFTAAQKRKILEGNAKKNGGIVKSDDLNDYYDGLVKPKKSMKGVTPDPNEWQIDYIVPKDKGGTNSYSNARVGLSTLF